MLPVSISGTNFGEFCDVLKAKMTINNCALVPEAATLTLLGLGRCREGSTAPQAISPE